MSSLEPGALPSSSLASVRALLGDGQVELADGFRLWRPFQLRSAGFPFETVLALAARQAAAAADVVLDEAAGRDSPARGALEEAWAVDEARVLSAIRMAAADPTIRTAVTWQSRHVVREAFDRLLAGSAEARDKRSRGRVGVVAAYVQRYAAKNDTIGFFGPIGWGRFVPGGRLHLQPGSAVFRRLRAHFEPWAMRAVAESIAADPTVRALLVPELDPRVAFGHGALIDAEGSRIALSADEAQLASRLSTLPAAELARALVAESAFASPDEVMARLGQWHERGLVVWGFRCDASGFPERGLLAQIEALPEVAVRAAARRRVAPLVEAKDSLPMLAGADLARAVEALERSFHEVTGRAPSRNPGEMYAGRSLLYADAMRDVEVSIGEEVARRLSGPLSILLRAARWFTFEVATRYRAALTALVGRLQGCSEELRLPRLWSAAAPLFDSLHPAPAVEVGELLRQRWACCVGPLDGRIVALRSDDLRAAATRLFDAPHPGWPTARHHCPDVLIAAAGPDAIRRGDYQVVLGELHVGLNVLSTVSATGQHPDVAELEELYAIDLPEPGSAPVPDEPWARCSHDSRLARDDWHVEGFGPWRSWRRPSQVVRAADLLVKQPESGPPRVVHVDGRDFGDLVEVFERPIKVRAVFNFDLFGEQPHMPRVTLDGVVIQRERWRVESTEAGFARHPDAMGRFLELRRLGRRLGWPRFVFVKAPDEVKPIFVDLDSPVLVELLGKIARRNRSFVVSEMLPGPGDLWLEDHAGRRFVAELRLVAVDPVPYPMTGRT